MRKPADDTAEKRFGTAAGLVRKDFRIRHAIVVVDRHMGVLPARAVDPHTPIAMDAMADADYARQPLHIDVHQLARMPHS